MTGIVVWTHNGKSPAEGGKRLGYQCGSTVWLLGKRPEGYSVADALRILGVNIAPKLRSGVKIAYCSLPQAIHRDGECAACRSYPNPSEQMSTDRGFRSVVRCRKCGLFMRPIEV